MGNFVGINVGGWTNGDDLTATQLNWFQDSIVKTINAQDGSSHTNSDPIEFEGKGWIWTGVLTVIPDDLTATFGDGSTVTCGTSHWFFGTTIQLVGNTNTLSLGTGSTFSMAAASLALIAGDIQISGTCEVSAVFNISGATTFAATSDPTVQNGCHWLYQNGAQILMQAGSQIELGGTNIFSGDITRTAKEIKSGVSARTQHRTSTLSNNADHNLSVDVDHYFYTQSSGTNRTQTLLKTTSPTPLDGECVSITVINSGGGLVSIQSEGSAQLIVSLNKSFTAECIYSSGAGHWRLKSASVNDGTAMIYGSDA